MTDLALQGWVRLAEFRRNTDDLIAGLALGADEILGTIGVHVLPVAQRQKGSSQAATHYCTGMTGAKFAERGFRFADGRLDHSRANNLVLAGLTASDTIANN
jgi:hypothetical protein